jgi:hypothetical protein
VSIDLDAEVAGILRAHAAEAHVSEGEIVDRAIRAYDQRVLIARIRERSALDEEQAMALAREELQAARAERDRPALTRTYVRPFRQNEPVRPARPPHSR